jgi:hypothetical protein
MYPKGNIANREKFLSDAVSTHSGALRGGDDRDVPDAAADSLRLLESGRSGGNKSSPASGNF